MDQTQQELTLDESIKQVMRTLPPVVRAYLAQGKYTAVAKNLMTKYALRIDQAGVLEREIMLLLMGVDSPDEFIQTLVEEAKLEQQTIKNIMQDVNTQIFVPLREEERKGGAVNIQSPVSPNTAEPEHYFHLENKIPPNIPPKTVQTTTAPPTFVSEKTVNADKLLEDHEEPHIEFGKAKTSAPPQNLPGAMPPASLNTNLTTPKSYTIDPYREPIEGK